MCAGMFEDISAKISCIFLLISILHIQIYTFIYSSLEPSRNAPGHVGEAAKEGEAALELFKALSELLGDLLRGPAAERGFPELPKAGLL